MMWNPLRRDPNPPFQLHPRTLQHTASLLLTTLFRLVVIAWIVALGSRNPMAVSGAIHLSFAWIVLYARIPQ
jgi:hypothetical protein